MTTVMVVEDDPVFLTRFCAIVASEPEFVLLAAVGDLASARRMLARQAPDVLLTDLGLPDGSGLDRQLCSIMAYVCARAKRFDRHRAWANPLVRDGAGFMAV